MVIMWVTVRIRHMMNTTFSVDLCSMQYSLKIFKQLALYFEWE